VLKVGEKMTTLYDKSDGAILHFGKDGSYVKEYPSSQGGVPNWYPQLQDGPLPEFQTVANPGGVLAPALLAGGAYFAGKHDLINRTANALNRPRRSVAMEGPMRFAGRGIPRNEGHYYHDPGLAGPDGPALIPIDPSVPIDPPRFPTLPGRAPISIWETSPDGGPRRGSRGGRERPIIPEVVYPPKDTRSEWEKWKDSFREDWAVRK
jgi:hypothetical protein